MKLINSLVLIAALLAVVLPLSASAAPHAELSRRGWFKDLWDRVVVPIFNPPPPRPSPPRTTARPIPTGTVKPTTTVATVPVRTTQAPVPTRASTAPVRTTSTAPVRTSTRAATATTRASTVLTRPSASTTREPIRPTSTQRVSTATTGSSSSTRRTRPTPVPHDPNSDGSFSTAFEIPSLARLEKSFGEFERVFELLPQNGRSPNTPWASTYWPSYLDNLNFRWQGRSVLSPVEKYAMAFGLDADVVSTEVSRQHGIRTPGHTKTCSMDWNCSNGDKCVARRGTGFFGKKYCVPTWEGICDGWAAASILLPEPKCAVTGPNGVVSS